MRDFRDAKAMAHALRNGLKAKAVETTHSECLELLAKAFGCESWNVLSAKIEATHSPEPDRQAHDPRFKEVLSCSFCGKTQHEVKELIAGPSVFVCDEFLANLIPKPAKPEPNRDFERTPLGRTGYFWMICRFTSARIFPQRECKLNEPNGSEPLRPADDRIIRVFWPINFAHNR